jgi:CRISPR-associated endonuclease Cas1
MLLEEHGYRVDQGMIYYAGSRERVRVILDDDLRMASRAAVNALRLIVSQGRIPPPLSDSPKCPRCALVTVCLPDEMGSIAGSSLAPRPIAVPTSPALPLIVQSQYARLSKDGETLKVNDEEAGETIVRMMDISDVALFGNVAITTPALTALLERDIPVSFHSHGGWFRGMAHGVGHRNVDIRTAQYRLSFDEAACLRFARDLVEAKVFNQRTMLRRNWRGTETTRQDCLDRLSAARRATRGAASAATLLGIEGDAAATYFRGLAGLLKPPPATADGDDLRMFRFDARNRRPPTDPVNAMLSLGYAMLTRHFTVALASVGLDPYRGFYHAPRYGRPALALDIMEPFRPLVVDSVVLSAINTGEIGTADFVVAATGTSLTQAGRRRFVAAFERRLSQETTHPLFGYQLSLRRLVIVQARLLTRFLLGEMPAYPHYLPR